MKFLSCKPIGLCVVFTIFQRHLCWVTQDVTAGCGALCAPQWHSVHSHQWHRPPLQPVTTLPLTTCSRVSECVGGGWSSNGFTCLRLATSAATKSLFLWVTMLIAPFFFFSSLGTKPQKASKCFSFYKEKEACLWMIFDSVLAHSIKGLGKTFKSQ